MCNIKNLFVNELQVSLLIHYNGLFELDKKIG